MRHHGLKELMGWRGVAYLFLLFFFLSFVLTSCQSARMPQNVCILAQCSVVPSDDLPLVGSRSLGPSVLELSDGSRLHVGVRQLRNTELLK